MSVKNWKCNNCGGGDLRVSVLFQVVFSRNEEGKLELEEKDFSNIICTDNMVPKLSQLICVQCEMSDMIEVLPQDFI